MNKKDELNEILSFNIKRNNKQSESLNHNYHTNILQYNNNSNNILENRNSNSKEYNNTAEKRPSFLLLNKNNNTQKNTFE